MLHLRPHRHLKSGEIAVKCLSIYDKKKYYVSTAGMRASSLREGVGYSKRAIQDFEKLFGSLKNLQTLYRWYL